MCGDELDEGGVGEDEGDAEEWPWDEAPDHGSNVVQVVQLASKAHQSVDPEKAEDDAADVAAEWMVGVRKAGVRWGVDEKMVLAVAVEVDGETTSAFEW